MVEKGQNIISQTIKFVFLNKVKVANCERVETPHCMPFIVPRLSKQRKLCVGSVYFARGGRLMIFEHPPKRSGVCYFLDPQVNNSINNVVFGVAENRMRHCASIFVQTIAKTIAILFRPRSGPQKRPFLSSPLL